MMHMGKSARLHVTGAGFTLIELLVVIGILAILAVTVIVAVNPGRQFASARDVTRKNDIYQVVNAVYQYSVENEGAYPPQISSSPQDIGVSGLNLSNDLAPIFIPNIPFDPSTGTEALTDYVLFLNGSKIIASASGELTETITVSR